MDKVGVLVLVVEVDVLLLPTHINRTNLSLHAHDKDAK